MNNNNEHTYTQIESRDRYNYFVHEAHEAAKIGGDPDRARVMAMLAQAEATRLANPDGSRIDVEVTGSLMVDR